MKLNSISLLFLFLSLVSCDNSIGQNNTHKRSVSADIVNSSSDGNYHNNGKTIKARFTPPSGYIRVAAQRNSFEEYLQELPLKPHESLVKYYNGDSKPNNNVYCAVIDLAIGNRNLHQCADAIMRLRAEHLWNQKEYNKIHFNFTNGFRVDYSEWMKGKRMIVQGNKTYWNNRNKPSNTYKDFWKYMELIFSYAGTASLEKELIHVDVSNVKIGDVLIQGGHPGHAVIILDKVTNSDGKSMYLLAQSYMPAQEIQVLNNPTNSAISPWYEFNEGTIITPEWNFDSSNIKSFQ